VIRGIHHVALLTGDFDRLLAFYRDVVGGEVVGEREWGEGDDLVMLGRVTGIGGEPRLRSAILRVGNAFVEIQHYGHPVGGGDPSSLLAQDYGIRHFALDVTEIEAEVERLAKAGMRFAGPVQQPSSRIKSIYGRDPDGNIVELQELLVVDSPLAIA
jgi:glyoxylase I family protein